MPRNIHEINLLRRLCGFPALPENARNYGEGWWHRMQDVMYWIGIIDFEYLDRHKVPLHLYFPGEPSHADPPQTCTQANAKLDNEYCWVHRKFVCEKLAINY